MMILIGRNQYLFTENINIEGYERKIKIGKYNLYLGEGCQYFDSSDGIYVLGYAIDVLSPKSGLKEMCITLRNAINNKLLGPQATRNWNGRFVVIFVENNNITIWNDCCGLKQVFVDVNDCCTFASQARYIAAIKNYSKDPEAYSYLELAKKKDKEYSFILDRTYYKEIYRILPNHYIQNGKIFRANIYKEKGTSKYAAELIKGSILGISKLGSLAITLTAGWDSRLVLSGVNNNYKAITVTLKYDWMEENNPDIVIATELAARKKMRHRVINCVKSDVMFYERYMDHSENGHEYWVQMAQAIEDAGLSNSIWVKGSCNEIIRNSFGILYNWQINENVLCKLYSLPEVPFVKDTIKIWLKTAKEFCKINNISVLDLFYWEHRMGSWLAECLNEADIVGEMFTPFNSRVYIENGLATKSKDRISPKYKFFNTILKEAGLVEGIPLNDERYHSLRAKLKLIIKNYLHLLYGILLNS